MRMPMRAIMAAGGVPVGRCRSGPHEPGGRDGEDTVAERTGGWDRWDTGAAITFGLIAVGVVVLDRVADTSLWPDLAPVLALGPGSYFLARWTDARSARNPRQPDTVEAAVARVAARRARAEQEAARRPWTEQVAAAGPAPGTGRGRRRRARGTTRGPA